MRELINRYKNWKYKNTGLLIVTFVALYFLSKNQEVIKLINSIIHLGYPGVFLVGIFFVSIFTAAPAIVVLYLMATSLDPVIIAIVAGAGAVVGDMLIFRFFKGGVFEEIAPLFKGVDGTYVGRIFATPYFSWLIPILGAIIIASPFPDEIGISLMGLSRVKNWQFAVISFALNATGIFVIVSLARAVI